MIRISKTGLFKWLLYAICEWPELAAGGGIGSRAESGPWVGCKKEPMPGFGLVQCIEQAEIPRRQGDEPGPVAVEKQGRVWDLGEGAASRETGCDEKYQGKDQETGCALARALRGGGMERLIHGRKGTRTRAYRQAGGGDLGAVESSLAVSAPRVSSAVATRRQEFSPGQNRITASCQTTLSSAEVISPMFQARRKSGSGNAERTASCNSW